MIHVTEGIPFSQSCQSNRVAGRLLERILCSSYSGLKRSMCDAAREVPEPEQPVMTP